jgi:hypothetical protein
MVSCSPVSLQHHSFMPKVQYHNVIKDAIPPIMKLAARRFLEAHALDVVCTFVEHGELSIMICSSF